MTSAQSLTVEQAESGDVTVTHPQYQIVHTRARGGSITSLKFVKADKTVPVEMEDGLALGGDGYLLKVDPEAQIKVARSDDGKSAVVTVDTRYQALGVARDACPAVVYRYRYDAASPLVRVEAEIPRQRPKAEFARLQQFLFNFPGEKSFGKLKQLITAGDGTIMPLGFELTPCESRPSAGLMRTDDAGNAFAMVSPVTGSFKLDIEAMHIRSGVFLDKWNGRRLTSAATLYVGPSDEIAAMLPKIRNTAAPRSTAPPAWRAVFKRADGGAMVMVESTDQTPEVTAEEAARRRVHRWRDLPAGESKVNVTVTEAPGENGLTNWSIDIQPADQRIGLWEVEFPVVSGIAPDPKSPTPDYLIFPFKCGTRIPNPTAAGLWEMPYPGAAGWPFLAWWQSDRGLYIGAHDPGASMKEFRSLPTGDGTLELSITHPVPNQGLPGTGWKMPFDIVIGPFTGDWFDAAQIYRAWLVKQEWFPKQQLHANTDHPQWIKDIVVATRRSGAGPFDNSIEEHPGSTFKEYHTGIMDEYNQLGRPPTLFWWYHAWFGGRGDDGFEGTPDFQTPPGFREGVERARAEGIRTIAYTLASWWDHDAPSWKDENAESAVVIKEDGKPFLHRHCGIMCHAAELYRKKMVTVAANLMKTAPIDGTYFDLGGTSGAELCYATNHGHPIGSGPWVTNGKREIMRQMRAEGRKVNPEFVLVMEGNADCYLDAVDGYANFESNVPMRQALTADYLRSAGDKRTHWEAAPLEAVNAAKHFAWGVPIGRFIGNELQAGGEFKENLVGHFRRLVRHKQVALPWLNYGKMMHAPQVTAIDPPGPVELAPDTLVPHATWQSPPDGSIAFVFANGRHSAPVKFKWTIDPAVCGIPTDGSWLLHTLEPDDQAVPKAKMSRIGVISGPIAREESLPKGGTLILVAVSDKK